MSDTLDLVGSRGWTCVLLRARSKRPLAETSWRMTRDLSEIGDHLRSGGNLGLVCGELSMTDVLDFDDVGAQREMETALGRLRETVRTGSGKTHVYVAREGPLPARIRWRGRIVGDIQRDRQYVVMPPSAHPDTGLQYEWIDPTPQFLPDSWRDALTDGSRPSWLTVGDARGVPDEETRDFPPADELISRALAQPGARRRAFGVKFQCPGCRAEGHDKSLDNAVVFTDGRWACAYDPDHKSAIGVALKAVGDPDLDDLRDVGVGDL